jgi:hypothetical protein
VAIRHRVPRAEAHQFLDDRFDAILRYLVRDLGDLRIDGLLIGGADSGENG